MTAHHWLRRNLDAKIVPRKIYYKGFYYDENCFCKRKRPATQMVHH